VGVGEAVVRVFWDAIFELRMLPWVCGTFTLDNNAIARPAKLVHKSGEVKDDVC